MGNAQRTTANGLAPADFAKRLWGDVYFNAKTRRFQRAPADSSSKRTFVQFILEPLYKIYAQILSDEGNALRATLEELGIQLKPSHYKLNTRPLLRLVLEQFFGDASGFVSMIQTHVPSPASGAPTKVRAAPGSMESGHGGPGGG